ncbi:MAG: response regulator [Nitrospirota bacterium]
MNPIKVLLVDDEVEFVSALAERLQLRNYDAKAVYCAEDAFALIKSDPPDVVLVDLRMPGMGGLEIRDTIRQFDPGIEVILLTGHGAVDEHGAGMKEVPFEYLLKPVDLNDLMEKIGSAAERRRTNAPDRRR